MDMNGHSLAASERGRSGVFLIADARGLALQVAEVEEAGAAHDASRHDLHLVDARRVREEHALHADVEAHFAHGERAARAGPVSLEDDALEDLNAILVAFDD